LTTYHQREVVSSETLNPEVRFMATVSWEITNSVETNASPAFAWHYWTNIANWDDPPAEFELEGPFATGSRGITRLPEQEPLHWIIREVTPPNAATIEVSLDGAALSFEWRFAGLADGRTRLTQRIVLKGEKADMYLSQVKAAFTANLSEGMNKLATAIANADPSRKSPTPDLTP
jgi:Polyketide cyclase / dehydrase and lipid transport